MNACECIVFPNLRHRVLAVVLDWLIVLVAACFIPLFVKSENTVGLIALALPLLYWGVLPATPLHGTIGTLVTCARKRVPPERTTLFRSFRDAAAHYLVVFMSGFMPPVLVGFLGHAAKIDVPSAWLVMPILPNIVIFYTANAIFERKHSGLDKAEQKRLAWKPALVAVSTIFTIATLPLLFAFASR